MLGLMLLYVKCLKTLKRDKFYNFFFDFFVRDTLQC